VEVWKTPLSNPQASATLAVDEVRAAFPTPRRRLPCKRVLGEEGSGKASLTWVAMETAGAWLCKHEKERGPSYTCAPTRR